MKVFINLLGIETILEKNKILFIKNTHDHTLWLDG